MTITMNLAEMLSYLGVVTCAGIVALFILLILIAFRVAYQAGLKGTKEEKWK